MLRLLRSRGWQLLSRNWRCRWGELDLVVAKPGRLLVVEVKGRATAGRDGHGLACIQRGQRQRLHRACRCWLAEHEDHGLAAVELTAALVPLAPSRQPVRWIPLIDWSASCD